MTLLEKMLKITEDFGSLEKTGTNPNFAYSYVKGETSMKQFRVLEIKHRIKVIPAIQPNTLSITPKGDKGFVTSFVMDYNIYDLDSQDKLVVSIPTQGYDMTDKMSFKGMTGSFKYFLLQTFSYSCDDPEKDDIEDDRSPKTTSKPVFKPRINTPLEQVVNTPNTPSKFSDMLPKSTGVSFKDSGLNKGFKPAGE